MKKTEYNTYLENEDRFSNDRLLNNGLVMGVGTSFPKTKYTQEHISRCFGIKNEVVHKLMASKHVQTRHLYLPDLDPETGIIKDETQIELNQKFIAGVKDIGVKAARKALKDSETLENEVDEIMAVTSTGFAVPGVSSMIARELKLNDSVHRLDVVGMGCNAGMSTLYSAANSIKANPNKTTLLVCCEINSASYVRDETIRTGIVNSLFGDGAAAIVLKGKEVAEKQIESSRQTHPSFSIIDFESFNITEQWDAMRFDLDEKQLKWSFFLSKDIPFVIGENMHKPVNKLLERNGIDKNTIKHWVMHTGGKAVIDGAVASLQIDEYSVRHTRSVLRDYGNLSSGSFLVSLERFYQEGSIDSGDFGVLIAMGPGSTIETALVKFF